MDRWGDSTISQDTAERLYEHLGGWPPALTVATRLGQVRGAQWLEGALRKHAIWHLAEGDEGARRWNEALSDAFQRLHEQGRETLCTVASFQDAIPEGWMEARASKGMTPLQGAGWIQVEEGAVAVARPLRHWLRVCDDGTGKRRAAEMLFDEYDRQEQETTASKELRRELHALMARGTPQDVKGAGIRLARAVVDDGELRQTLRYLISAHGDGGQGSSSDGGSSEVNLAIARLHFALGELAPAWRRVGKNWRNHGPEMAHVAGNILRRRSRPEEARAAYEEAVAGFERAGETRALGEVLGHWGGLSFEQGEEAQACGLWARALRCHRSIGDRRGEAKVLGDLGLLDMGRGKLAEAQRRYERALVLHREVGNERYCGIVLGDLGELALRRGDAAAARTQLQESLVFIERTQDAWQAVYVRGLLAVARAFVGEVDEAKEEIGTLRDQAPAGQEAFLRLCEGALPLGQARVARRAGQVSAAEEWASYCEKAIEGAPSSPDEVRRLGGVITAELARYRRHSGWVLALDGDHFITPAGQTTPLGRRKILRRLVSALAEAHGSGRWLEREALIRVGWPAQRSANASAKNRFNVALTNLRKLGMGPLIEREGTRYRLDPGVVIEIVQS